MCEMTVDEMSMHVIERKPAAHMRSGRRELPQPITSTLCVASTISLPQYVCSVGQMSSNVQYQSK